MDLIELEESVWTNPNYHIYQIKQHQQYTKKYTTIVLSREIENPIQVETDHSQERTV